MRVILSDLVEAIAQAEYSALEQLPEYGTANRVEPLNYEPQEGLRRGSGLDYSVPDTGMLNARQTEYETLGGLNQIKRDQELDVSEHPGNKVDRSYTSRLEKQSLGSREMGPDTSGGSPGPDVSDVQETYRVVPGSFKRMLLEDTGDDKGDDKKNKKKKRTPDMLDLQDPRIPLETILSAGKYGLDWIRSHGGDATAAFLAVPPRRMAAAWAGNLQQLGLDQSSVDDYANYYSKILNEPLSPINWLGTQIDPKSNLAAKLGKSAFGKFGLGVLNRLSNYGLDWAGGLNNQLLNLAVRATLDPRAKVPSFTQVRQPPTDKDEDGDKDKQTPPDEGSETPVPAPTGGGFGGGSASASAQAAMKLPPQSHGVNYDIPSSPSGGSYPQYVASWASDRDTPSFGNENSIYSSINRMSNAQPSYSTRSRSQPSKMNAMLAYGGPLRNKSISTGYSVS
jgi:hypothetical protein